MKNFLKRNWFVVVIACLFLAFTIFFVYDQNKDVLKGKTARGSGVIYSLDDQDFTADDLYEKFYPTSGNDAAYSVMIRTLLDETVKTDDEMKSSVDSLYNSYIAYYQQNYGTMAEYYLNNQAQYLGFETFKDYLLYNAKQERLDRDYLLAHQDQYWDTFAKQYDPRIIYHALVLMEDPDNPTEEESKAFDEAKAAWESGNYKFEDFAKEFSDDSSSAVNGGLIGYVDNQSYGTFVEEFVDASLTTKEGEVSEWTKSSYGYHLIYNSSQKAEDCLKDTSCLERLLGMYPNMDKAVVWEKLQELKVTFANEELETHIKELLEVQEDGTIKNDPVEINEDDVVIEETQDEQPEEETEDEKN